MLQHTSGLRDWGDIAMLSGWPRTTRAYTHAHVLDIISRQTALNFAPGTDWSYSNSGYNLAAMLVARVSGQPFAEYTRMRLFEPLGMRHTSWRDDHTRIVKGRATAYDVDEGRLVTLMPFEDVHGNGGLLTTVGDLLRWNEHLQAGRVVDQAFVQELETPGRLANGRSHGYGLGLRLGDYRGLREVWHSGTTAGYRAYLVRFPDQRFSVAVLCNVGSADAERLAHGVADQYLGAAFKEDRRLTAIPLGAGDLANVVGDFRGTKRGNLVSIVREQDGLRVAGGPQLVPTAPGRFDFGGSVAETFPESGMPVTRIRVSESSGSEDVYERVTRAKPSLDQLTQYAGTYRTPEVEGDLRVVVEKGTLTILQRPDRAIPLRPLYADAFGSPLGLVRFARDAGGRPTHLSVGTDRAWDVRFARVPDGPVTPATR
jgi:CubicO group peptidase (beta-lactamase class C family)